MRWLACCLLLSACAGTPQFGDGRQPPSQLEILLLQAENNPMAALSALQLAVRMEQWQTANELINTIDTRNYHRDTLADYSLAALRVWQQQRHSARAMRWLNSTALQQQLPLMRRKNQLALSVARANALYDLGRYYASAQERLYLDALLRHTDEREENERALWQSLTQVSPTQLKRQLQRSDDATQRAWIELALIHHASQLDIATQANAVDEWLARWPQHSASSSLPHSVDILQSLPQQRPRIIAVLLPLSGPLASRGRAIQDGLAAAHFTAREKEWQTPRINSYDTQTQSIEQLYQRALQDGADFIIGPLQKNKVAQLLSLPLNVPTITLNYLTGNNKHSETAVQYGLATEDEALQLAQRARTEGHKNILLLRSSANWSARTADAFSQRWQTSGGRIIASATLSSPTHYSREIADQLLLPDSGQRHRTLQQTTGQKLEFTPRRRNDIDAVVVFANAAQTKSIKPLLAYHYAGKLPVYSSSKINDGSNERNKNRDLNGIIFHEIPWLLDSPAIKRQAAAKYRDNKNLGRLFALGVDAFYLHPRIAQLQQNSDNPLYGLTGHLSLQEQRIVRQLVAVTFRHGKVVPLVKTAERGTARRK